MPIVEAVPIKTKDRGFFKATWVWLTVTRKWEIKESWRYKLKNGVTIIIPAGFIFDGASVPRTFRQFLSPTGLLFIPGLLHDYAYKHNELIQLVIKGSAALTMPYKSGAGKMFWDKMFREEANRVNGMAPINAAAWSALFIGGHFTWWGHRKKDAIKKIVAF
jgi:hypothetical protein